MIALRDTCLIQLENNVILNAAILRFGAGKGILALIAPQDSI